MLNKAFLPQARFSALRCQAKDRLQQRSGDTDSPASGETRQRNRSVNRTLKAWRCWFPRLAFRCRLYHRLKGWSC